MKLLNILVIGMMLLMLFGCVGEPPQAPGTPNQTQEKNQTMEKDEIMEKNQTQEQEQTQEQDQTQEKTQTQETTQANETPGTDQAQPYCGDGIINQATESCEKGVPCKDPTEICDGNICKCMVEAEPAPTCYQNTELTAANQPGWQSGMVCKDDCPSAMYCDASACVCMQKTTVSCSGVVLKEVTPLLINLTIVTKTNDTSLGAEPIDLVPIPSGGSQYSVDSFFDVFTELSVDSGTPVAREIKVVATPESFFDVFTKVNLTVEPAFDPDTMVCKDDCASLGTDYACNAATCNCEYKPKKTFSCYSNTKAQVYNSTSKKFINVFDQVLKVCSNDCSQAAQEYGGTWTCNPKTCTCEQTPVSCSSNTRMAVNKYNWQYGTCEDNCDTLGKDYKCDPFKCVCIKEDLSTRIQCGNGVVDKGEACEYDNQCPFGSRCVSCQCMEPVKIVQ